MGPASDCSADEWQVGDVDMQKAVVEVVLINDKDWPVEIEIVPPYQLVLRTAGQWMTSSGPAAH